jgi:thiol-disulfide isomerase/thioredoxin
MNRSRLLLVPFLLASLAAIPVQAQSTMPMPERPTFGLALAPGDPAPPIEVPDLYGRPAKHPYDTAKVTLVNFWATWCEPCRREMPILQELADRRAEDGLRVVGVLFDEVGPVEALEFAEALAIRYPLVRGTLEFDRAWGGVHVLPASFLVDSRGRLLRKYVGADDKQVEVLRSDVAAALEGRTLSPPYLPAAPETSTIP